MQKCGKFMETRFNVLEHELKMRLLETHSHTSELRDYEADMERQAKGKETRPIRKGQEKRQRKLPPDRLKGVGRGENVSTGKHKTEVAPQP